MSQNCLKAAPTEALLPAMRKKNEEFTAATDRIDQPWDCCGWVKPYCDEPLVDKKWVGDYQARKQHVVDKYAEFNYGKAAKQLA